MRIERDWNIATFDAERAKHLAETLAIPPLAAHLLLRRGVDGSESAQRFLRPLVSHLSDPTALSDVDAAVARISKAREAGAQVLVFGDYDVDGIAATALMVNGLRRYGFRTVQHGMPHRLQEGYGLTPSRVDAARDRGVSLIITVDNGIAAHEAADRARELGISLIVTDHHSIERGLPNADAVINPRRETPDHPCYHISGAGVAFKLCSALTGTPNDLDIAALGTVADVVPLSGENRVIVSLGLRHMAKHRRVGIDRLAASAGVDLADVSAENIGFQLGPRINAAGRLDDAGIALDLLMTDSGDAAARLARVLNDANQERRTIEQAIYDEACEELDAFVRPDQRSIVLAREGWHIGVIGIVAARIATRYGRPTMLIALEGEGRGRASGRSGPAPFNFIEALRACRAHLIQFGGHKAAAGASIAEMEVDVFRQTFEWEALRQLGPGPLRTRLDIDAQAVLSQVDSRLVQATSLLEPLGNGNPAPVFASMGVEVLGRSVRTLKDKHLRFEVKQNGRVFPVIGFGMAERYHQEGFGQATDIAYTPQFNTWRGETSIQLLLRDFRPSGAA